MITSLIFTFLITQGQTSCNDLNCINCQNGPCTLCKNGYSLGETLCVACSSGYYSDGLTCLLCQQGCQTCQSQTQCLQCLDSYYLDTNLCYQCQSPCLTCTALLTCTLCKEGFYWNSSSCQLCDTNCMECQDSPTECTNCYTSYYLQYNQGSIVKGQCVTQCPTAFYPSPSHDLKRVCYQCDQSCQECSGKNSCKSCSTGYLFKNQCISSCGLGYIANDGTHICDECAPNCIVCTTPSPNSCSECDNTTYFYNQQCLVSCPQGYYADQARKCQVCDLSCLTCNGPLQTNCLTCQDIFLKKTNSCTLLCPEGHFINFIELSCENCSENCLKCDNSTICLQCNEGHFLNILNFCVANCPDGYYGLVSSRICKICDSQCLTCTGASDCLICADSKVYYLGECILECPQGTFQDLNNCKKCPDGCLSCLDLNNCNTCEFGYKFYQNACYMNCPTSTYTKAYTCMDCIADCAICNNSNSCLKCNDQTFYTGIVCSQTCPSDHYSDNIMRVCYLCDQSCATCFGASQYNCLSCEAKYLYNNQCIHDCPTGYYGYTDTQVCVSCLPGCVTCANGQGCLTCPQGYYKSLLKYRCRNACVDYQYSEPSTRFCESCNSSCLKCFGPQKDQCLICKSDTYFYKFECRTICPEGTFPNANNICQGCHFTCSSCIDPSESCTQCVENKFLSNQQCLDIINQCPKYVLNGQCVEDCGLHKFANPNSVCLECSVQCSECENSPKNCINSCAGNRQTFPQCTCPTGYQIDSPTAMCIKCYFRCSTCTVSEKNCLQCASNRRDPPQCSCPAGYFEANENPECQVCPWQCATCNKDLCLTCRGDRVGLTCYCLPGKYEDLINLQENCINCDVNCSSCAEKATYCTSCQSNQIKTKNSENSNYYQCECPAGYYENGKYLNCLICDFKCETCESEKNNCTLCRGNRIITPFCQCEQGYFDDQINDNCQKCDITCKTCDINGCITCAGNRQGPNLKGQCTCSDNVIDLVQTQSPNCSTCTLGVPYIKFQDSLDSMYIIIGSNIIFKDVDDPTIGTRNNCQKIFSSEDFNKLGQGIPLCYVNPQNQMQIIIQFGDQAQLQIGDSIILNTLSQFGIKDCQRYFTQMESAIINPPDSPALGYVKFTGPQYIDLCSQIQFYPNQNFNDGKRGFIMKSWSIKSIIPNDQNTRSIVQYIFDQATIDKNSKITIPELTLSEYSEYVFTYKFINFLGQELQSDYTLITTTFNSPSINIQQLNPFIYNNNVRITLTANIQHLNCKSGKVEIIQDNINYKWFSKYKNGDQSNLLSKSNNLYGIKPSNSQYVSLMIPPYQGISGLEYYITLQATLIDQDISAYYTINVIFIKQDLQVQIIGGSRVNGYSVPLYVKGQIKDPNIEINQNEGINYLWKCQNLISNLPCTDIYNEVIILNNTLQQAIAGKKLIPYNSYRFTLNATKDNMFKIDSIVIVIIELDLPLLELNKPDYLTSQKVNLNQELKMKFIYPTTNPDNFYYGGVLIYDYNVVAILRFYYTSITIKIWDYFYEFQDLSQIGFRASVYDPHFFMPSTASILININLPPRNCKLAVNPTYGISFDTYFNIEVTNCEDNIQLSSKFSFYLSPTFFEKDILNAQSYNLNLLYDYQIDNKIETLLPYPSQDQFPSQPFLVLMVSIQDSSGGFTNLTSNVVIGRDGQDLQNQLRISELIKKKQQITDQNDLLQSYFKNRQLSEEIIDRLIFIYGTVENQSIQKQISLLNLLALGVVNEQFDKSKLLTLKLNILAKLLYFQEQNLSSATTSQIVKSIALLMNDEDIIQSMTTETTYYRLNDVNLTLISNLNQIAQIENDIEKGYIDFRLFREKENLQNDIMRAAGQLDGLLSASQRQYDSIISQNLTNIELQLLKIQENNYLYLGIMESLKIAFINDDPNSPPKFFIGNSYSLKSQLVTQGKLTENLGGVNPFVSEQTIQISEDKEYTTPTNHIITFHQTEYKDNPYITDNTFPKRDILTSIQFIEPRLENGSILVPKQLIPIKFNITSIQQTRNLQTYQDLYTLDVSPFSQNLVCIGKSQNGEWDVGGGNCKSFIEIDTTGALYVTCKCQELTITTVQDFLSDIINVEKFSRAFTIEAVIALFSFPFYKSIIVYALLFMTAALFFSVSYGFRKDLQESNEKILHNHFVESEFIRITALEKAKQKSQQKRKEYISHKNQSIDLEEHIDSEEIQEADDYLHKLSEEEHIKNQFLLIQPDLDPEELIKLNESSQTSNAALKVKNNEQKETINLETDNIIQISSQGNDLDQPQLRTQNQPQSNQTYELLDKEKQIDTQNQDKFVQIDNIEEKVNDFNQFEENNENNQVSQNADQNTPKILYKSDQIIQVVHKQEYSDDILFLSSCLRNHRDSFEKSPNPLVQKKVKFDLKLTQKSLLIQPIDSESDDEELEKSDPDYNIKEDKVIKWHRDYKKEKFIENQCNLQFTLNNILLFIRIFHPILGIFIRFERRQPRPIRFCIVYMTILNTCYINIYFQVPLQPFQSIIFSIFSALIQDIEIIIIKNLMAQKIKLIRGLGWIIFISASVLFIYLIIITMAFEAKQKQDDVRRSNEWGLNFIIGFIFTNFVAVPIKLILTFKTLQLSLNNSTGILSKLMITIFADPATDQYFEIIQ